MSKKKQGINNLFDVFTEQNILKYIIGSQLKKKNSIPIGYNN